MKANELMEQVTERVIKSIEEGLVAGKWTKPWRSNNDGFYAPSNVITKKRYSGGNFLWLMWLGNESGFASGTWGTYKQWESIERQVRKGEHGTKCIKWVERRCKDHGPDEGCNKCGQMFPSVFTVFNECQLADYEPKPVDQLEEKPNKDERIRSIDDFFASLGGTVNHRSGGMAFYSPRTDSITMPEFEDFIDATYYYSTLSHEFAHWTGHESRLNREGITKANTSQEIYAREELIAELSATMLCAVLGIEEQPREDHAQYLQAWLQHLRSDKGAIFKAAAKASKATEYLLAQGKIDQATVAIEASVA